MSGARPAAFTDELALAGRRRTASTSTNPAWPGAPALRRPGRLPGGARGGLCPSQTRSDGRRRLNHIYEHVVNPEAVVADIHRVLHPWGPLPCRAISGRSSSCITDCPCCRGSRNGLADRYRLAGSVTSLRALLHAGGTGGGSSLPTTSGLHVARARRPVAFAGDDIVPAWVSRLPERALATLPPRRADLCLVGFGARGAPDGLTWPWLRVRRWTTEPSDGRPPGAGSSRRTPAVAVLGGPRSRHQDLCSTSRIRAPIDHSHPWQCSAVEIFRIGPGRQGARKASPRRHCGKGGSIDHQPGR